jgi:hypothetical protein
MMKHTLEKFVSHYVSVVISFTIAFDLWMNKYTFDIFAFVN